MICSHREAAARTCYLAFCPEAFMSTVSKYVLLYNTPLRVSHSVEELLRYGLRGAQSSPYCHKAYLCLWCLAAAPRCFKFEATSLSMESCILGAFELVINTEEVSVWRCDLLESYVHLLSLSVISHSESHHQPALAYRLSSKPKPS